MLEAGKGQGGRIDTSIMEKRLGYNCGALTGDDLFVINIGDVNKHQVRIPLGTEMGCNEHWICGGYTEGMMPEGIAYNVKNPNIYLNDDFSKDIEVECLKSKK